MAVTPASEVLKMNALEVNELGEVKLKLAELKKREKELADSLKLRMKVGDVIVTEKFRAELSESNNRILDMTLVRKLLGQKRFLAMAKIGVGDLEKVCGKEEIDRATSGYDPVKSLNVKPIA